MKDYARMYREVPPHMLRIYLQDVHRRMDINKRLATARGETIARLERRLSRRR